MIVNLPVTPELAEDPGSRLEDPARPCISAPSSQEGMPNEVLVRSSWPEGRAAVPIPIKSFPSKHDSVIQVTRVAGCRPLFGLTQPPRSLLLVPMNPHPLCPCPSPQKPPANTADQYLLHLLIQPLHRFRLRGTRINARALYLAL